MDLAPALERGLAVVEDGPLDVDAILALLARKAAHTLLVNESDLLNGLRMRERVRSTALPEGVALPHAILAQIPRTLVIPAVIRSGVVFDLQHPPATVIISLFGNLARPWDHIKMLARVARIAQNHASLLNIRGAIDADDLIQRVLKEDAAHA